MTPCIEAGVRCEESKRQKRPFRWWDLSYRWWWFQILSEDIHTPATSCAVQLRPFCGINSNGFRGGVGCIGVTHIGFGAVIRYESHSHNGLEVGSSAFLPVMAVRLVPTIPANPNMGYF